MKINIKDKLQEKGISRYELAKRIDVTYPTIDNIYKGSSVSVKFEILEAICKELNCYLDEILIFDDEKLKEEQQDRIHKYYDSICKYKKKRY